MMKKLLFILAVVILGVSCSNDSQEDNVVSYSVRILDDFTFEGNLPDKYEDEYELMDSIIKVLWSSDIHFGIYNIIAETMAEADAITTAYVQRQLDNFPTQMLLDKFQSDDFELVFYYGAYRYDEILSTRKVYIPLKLKFSTKTGPQILNNDEVVGGENPDAPEI